MPINTTLDKRVGPPGSSPDAQARAEATICSVISAAERFLVSPA
ncbi:unannotated protein [freshwater metagenome]|uniref:Unannotated protein n=1 Tax=freshwater metagenome TaxID=449393 RepID=A0A6J7BIJ2_9ZZZZ